MNNIYKTKDKQIAPFLLTQSEVSFLGTSEEGYSLYFQFSPEDKCTKLVNAFISKTAPPVQPKDLLDAIETYRDRVFEMKDKNKYERRY